jgi:hypothetical protein
VIDKHALITVQQSDVGADACASAASMTTTWPTRVRIADDVRADQSFGALRLDYAFTNAVVLQCAVVRTDEMFELTPHLPIRLEVAI